MEDYLRRAITKEAIGHRLLLTRLALKLTQVEFAERADLRQNQYNPYEVGKRRLSLDAALALAACHRLTLDWLYFGDPGNLPYALADAIKEHKRSNPGPVAEE